MTRQKLAALLASILILAPTLLSGTVNVVRQNDGFVIHTMGTPFSRFRVKVLGDVIFTRDSRDVETLSPGGYLSIERREFLRTTKVVFEADDLGRITRTFFKGNFSDDIDDHASNWIKEAILETFYLTGLGAEGRINRMLSDGEPVEIILALAARMSGSEGKYHFYKALGRHDISTEDRVAMAISAGGTVSSSYWLGLILREWGTELTPADEFAGAIIEATNRMGSSYETSRTLTSLSENMNMDATAGLAMVHVISGISSSYEQAKTVINVAPRLLPFPEVMSELILATAAMSSSYEQKRSLTALSRLDGLEGAHYAHIASVAANISSAYELGQTLRQLTEVAQVSDNFVESYLESVRHISSSYEQARTLVALSQMTDLTADHVIWLLDHATDISSSYETGRVLGEVANRPELNDAEMIAFLDVVASISSSHEQSQAMVKLIKGHKLSADLVRRSILVAREISNSSARNKVTDLLIDRL